MKDKNYLFLVLFCLLFSCKAEDEPEEKIFETVSYEEFRSSWGDFVYHFPVGFIPTDGMPKVGKTLFLIQFYTAKKSGGSATLKYVDEHTYTGKVIKMPSNMVIKAVSSKLYSKGSDGADETGYIDEDIEISKDEFGKILGANNYWFSMTLNSGEESDVSIKINDANEKQRRLVITLTATDSDFNPLWKKTEYETNDVVLDIRQYPYDLF